MENRKIYNMLSKGIHELDETDCEAGYQVLRTGIVLILDEEIERRRQSRTIAEASKSLQQLQAHYKAK